MKTSQDTEVRERVGQLEGLLQEIDAYTDPAVQDRTRQIVQGILDYHGAALARILEHIAQAGEPGQQVLSALGNDELVSSLLLLYGLHPLDLETRVQQALEKVRPYTHSHGGNIELIGVVDGVVRLRMEGSCHGCPSSAMTLQHTVEQAIFEKAPDIAGIEVEGAVPPPEQARSGFVPVEELFNKHSGGVALKEQP